VRQATEQRLLPVPRSQKITYFNVSSPITLLDPPLPLISTQHSVFVHPRS
jgi:hypothetical protein